MNGLAQLADASAMNDPHLQDAAGLTLRQIRGDDWFHIPRTKRVQVQHAVDRKFDGLRTSFFEILSAVHVPQFSL